jgi:hypothetical protein
MYLTQLRCVQHNVRSIQLTNPIGLVTVCLTCSKRMPAYTRLENFSNTSYPAKTTKPGSFLVPSLIIFTSPWKAMPSKLRHHVMMSDIIFNTTFYATCSPIQLMYEIFNWSGWWIDLLFLNGCRVFVSGSSIAPSRGGSFIGSLTQNCWY